MVVVAAAVGRDGGGSVLSLGVRRKIKVMRMDWPRSSECKRNWLFWSYLIFMNNFLDISFAPWIRPLFTVLHNDVFEGETMEIKRGPGLRIQRALSLSPFRSPGGNSAASYLTPCDWNTSSTRAAACGVMIFVFVSLSQERRHRQALSPSQHTDACACVSARGCLLCVSGHICV